MPFHYLILVIWIFARFFQIPHCKNTGSVWLPVTEKLRRFQKFKFKIVIWHIFLSPIEFSEKKRPLRNGYYVLDYQKSQLPLDWLILINDAAYLNYFEYKFDIFTYILSNWNIFFNYWRSWKNFQFRTINWSKSFLRFYFLLKSLHQQFFLIFDAGFHIYLISRLQKYALI